MSKVFNRIAPLVLQSRADCLQREKDHNAEYVRGIIMAQIEIACAFINEALEVIEKKRSNGHF